MSVTTSHAHAHSSPTHDSVDKIRRLIDEEIRALEDHIRALKSRRNILTPISHLPPEILSKIFAFRAADSIRSTNPLEWIRVSHVSRHWRAVALDCPSLWGNLVFTRPKWCEEMLRRSKMAGLIVKADLTYLTPKIFEAVRLAILHSPRIHELQLCATTTTFEKLLSTNPPLRAPMIRSLSLSVPLTHRYGTDQWFTIPDSFLDSETPYLRELDLHKCNIGWDSRLFNGLTRLTIHDVQNHSRPTTDQLLNTLKRMPALEVLDFRNALPLSPPGTPVSTSPRENMINLSQLTDLIIISTVPECQSLVSRIKIPATARVHLDCNGTEDTGTDFSGITRIIANPKGTRRGEDGEVPVDRKTIRALQISYDSVCGFVFQGWTAPLSPESAQSDINTPDIQLELSWPYFSPEDLDAVLPDICKAIPIGHLRSLRFAYVPCISKETWTKTFGCLPKLHSVHVAGEPVHNLIAALRDPTPRPLATLKSPLSPGGMLGPRQPALRRKRSTIPAVYFPHLKSLTIQYGNFSGDPYTEGFKALRDCLVERSHRKAEIQELRLRECSYIYEEDIESLKEVVSIVDWDKLELDDEYSEAMSEEDELSGYIFSVFDEESNNIHSAIATPY